MNAFLPNHFCNNLDTKSKKPQEPIREKMFKKVKGKDKLKCMNCRGKIEYHHEKIVSHKVTCWRGKVFKCDRCEELGAFLSLESLRRHLKEIHQGEDGELPTSDSDEIEKYLVEIEAQAYV